MAPSRATNRREQLLSGPRSSADAAGCSDGARHARDRGDDHATCAGQPADVALAGPEPGRGPPRRPAAAQSRKEAAKRRPRTRQRRAAAAGRDLVPAGTDRRRSRRNGLHERGRGRPSRTTRCTSRPHEMLAYNRVLTWVRASRSNCCATGSQGRDLRPVPRRSRARCGSRSSRSI